MLTKALALKWAEEGIRVNAVAPGYIETAINAAGRNDLAHYQSIADRTAFKRWGRPKDIAGAVAVLCMPASQYATGTVFAVDGGFSQVDVARAPAAGHRRIRQAARCRLRTISGQEASAGVPSHAR
jgi:NAD(P)-dependent dehydrogenase (short-subunit alcohol dehydrogenase family)